jgi:hypothetical protein
LASFSHNHSENLSPSCLGLFFHRSSKTPSSLPHMVPLLGSPLPSNPLPHLVGSGFSGGHHSTSSREAAPPLWAGGAIAPLRLHRDPLVSQCQSVSGGLVWVSPPFTPGHATTLINLNNALGGTVNIHKGFSPGGTLKVHKALSLRYNLESGFSWSTVDLGGLASLGCTFGIHKGLPLRDGVFSPPPPPLHNWKASGLGGTNWWASGPGGGNGEASGQPPPPETSYQASGLEGGDGEASGQPSPPPTS